MDTSDPNFKFGVERDLPNESLRSAVAEDLFEVMYINPVRSVDRRLHEYVERVGRRVRSRRQVKLEKERAEADCSTATPLPLAERADDGRRT